MQVEATMAVKCGKLPLAKQKMIHRRGRPTERRSPLSRCVKEQQIFVMNAEGTDMRQLTSGNAENIHPTWSPDSTRILFNTTHFSGATAADGRDVPSANKVIGEKIDEKMDLATIKPDGTGLKESRRRAVTP